MSDPGYGPNGFLIGPTGKVTWEGNKPPETKSGASARTWAVAVGFGSIPRKTLIRTNEVLRVKVA